MKLSKSFSGVGKGTFVIIKCLCLLIGLEHCLLRLQFTRQTRSTRPTRPTILTRPMTITRLTRPMSATILLPCTGQTTMAPSRCANMTCTSRRRRLSPLATTEYLGHVVRAHIRQRACVLYSYDQLPEAKHSVPELSSYHTHRQARAQNYVRQNSERDC